MTESLPLNIDESQAGLRLDKALSELTNSLSRSRIQQLITGGHVTLNGEVFTDAKKKVAGGESCVISIPEAVEATPKPQNIPLDIVYEDDMLLVINKPVGLTVHPGAGNPDGTLVNALLFHCPATLSGVGGIARPGIVHRIDKDTSGLLIVAKNDTAHRALAAQLEDRSLSRRYRAMVWGLPNPSTGTINAAIGRDPKNRQRMTVVDQNIPKLSLAAQWENLSLAEEEQESVTGSNGKHAVTHYKLLEAYGTLVSLVECQLETGRTHQIRVHMKHVGHPLIGDATYGSRKGKQLKHHDEVMVAVLRDFPRQALHAYALKFIHPTTSEAMEFTAEMPEDMNNLRETLLSATRAD